MMPESKKAILIVSFGTTYKDTRDSTICAIERMAKERFPDWEVRRAFTSRMVIRRIMEREGLKVDYVSEAMQRLALDGFEDVVIQPTHIMNGMEYDDVVRIAYSYEMVFRRLVIGKPLLTSERDYDLAVEAIEYIFGQYVRKPRTALVLMGHGSEHYANATYSQLQMKLWLARDHDVYVTTTEGFPSYDDTIMLMSDRGYENVVLFPFMIVAGDHANNDMAGDEDDSLRKRLEACGYHVECVLRGMGEFQVFRELFMYHINAAIGKLDQVDWPA